MAKWPTFDKRSFEIDRSSRLDIGDDITMRVTMLVLSTALLPLVWGWGTHWIMVRLWPGNRPNSGDHGTDTRPPARPCDYQI